MAIPVLRIFQILGLTDTVAALAGRHPKDDVRRTLMRLDVVGQLDLQGSRYTPATAEAEQG